MPDIFKVSMIHIRVFLLMLLLTATVYGTYPLPTLHVHDINFTAINDSPGILKFMVTHKATKGRWMQEKPFSQSSLSDNPKGKWDLEVEYFPLTLGNNKQVANFGVGTCYGRRCSGGGIKKW